MSSADQSLERVLALPEPRGPLTESLVAALRTRAAAETVIASVPSTGDPLVDEDLQLALYVCYELHYAHLVGVDEHWEWSPALLRLRADLEAPVERALRELAGGSESACATVGDALQHLVAEDAGPPLSRYLETQGTLQQICEHVIHRSGYQLKEADPHSWAIPRLTGAPKAALMEIQADEYGGGDAQRMHSTMFGGTMLALGLDNAYGAHLDLLPGITLATVNMISLFGLHRRLRGALVGHIAVFEMTSSIPNRRYGNALRRHGFGRDATAFYDEHIEADAVHESVAAWDLADTLAKTEPELGRDILFGARALLALEASWANHLLAAWHEDESSLRRAATLLV